MAEETFSGSFDSSSVASAPSESLRMTGVRSEYLTACIRCRVRQVCVGFSIITGQSGALSSAVFTQGGKICLFTAREKEGLKDVLRELVCVHGRTAWRRPARESAGEDSLAVFDLEGCQARHTGLGYGARQFDGSVLKL